MANSLPATMRAMQWTTTVGGIENNLSLNASAPLPKNASSLPKDSTLVKVAYTTVNPVDYKVPEMTFARTFAISKPATPCMDFSGTVASTTRSDLRVGDKVFGKTEPPVFGALGEYAVVGPNGCVKLPDDVSLKEAAGLGVCGLTAYQTLMPFVKDGDSKGMNVLVNGGSGGVGTYVLQIAKLLGCSVTATCSGPNVDLCKSLGADEVLDYKSLDVVAELTRRGTQYDLLIDAVNIGGSPLYYNAHHYLKPSAPYITIAGDVSATHIWNLLSMFLLPAFLGGGQRTPKFVMCASNAEQYSVLGKWMKEGKLKTVVDEVYGLEQAAEAFRRSKSRRSRGKVLIEVFGE